MDIVNGAAIDGGGIHVQAGAALTATGVTISGNGAAAGFTPSTHTHEVTWDWGDGTANEVCVDGGLPR